ncbi:MAG: DUF222 domain-containing protein [Nakamurella sp.]
MAITEVLQAAKADSAAVRAGLQRLVNSNFLSFSEPELLDLAKTIESVARLAFTAQVQIAGTIDKRKMAESFGASSTSALLRQTLQITNQDARLRLNTAKAVLPQDAISGGDIAAVLPRLGTALHNASIGVEQTRTIVSTMTKLPAAVAPELRETVEELLVDEGQRAEPKPFAQFARSLADYCDPDGKLDERSDPDKVELHIGGRNPDTGMTPIRGQLDDEGVELLQQSIGGLSKPRIEPDGSKDKRSNSVRQGQALKELLRMFLDRGDAPTHGGERPHVTVTMRYDDLKKQIADAVLSYGGPISAAEARRIACDAHIIPAVLGSDSEVLDVGRAQRLIPPPIRRAITLRDKGCSFPGCDRPPGWTDAHHVLSWLQHGESSYHNSCLLCRYHHTVVHQGDWKIVFAADGIPEFIPPPWVDPDQKPRRNTANRLTTLLPR